MGAALGAAGGRAAAEGARRRGAGGAGGCEELIAAGRVTVNGEVAVLGRRVDPDADLVEVDGAPVGHRPGLVHYLLNKPRASSRRRRTPTAGRPSSSSCRPSRGVPGRPPRRRHRGPPAADQRRRAGQPHRPPVHGVEKEYLADVERRRGGQRRGDPPLRDGVELDDGVTAPAKVSAAEPGRAADHDPRGPQPPGPADVRGRRPPGAPARAHAHRPAHRPPPEAGRVARARPPTRSAQLADGDQPAVAGAGRGARPGTSDRIDRPWDVVSTSARRT